MKTGCGHGIFKKKHLIGILFVIIISISGDLQASLNRMMGPNLITSWSSSYLIIDSGSATVNDKSAWTSATAVGWFFDYKTTPHVSFRTSWFCFPSFINKDYDNFNRDNREVNLHDIGFSLLRHFNISDIDLWFGSGIYWQFSTFSNINSYTLYATLSFGIDYEITDGLYLCPEIVTGLGMKLIKRSEQDKVEIEVPTGSNFSSNGFVVFFKLGVAKAF